MEENQPERAWGFSQGAKFKRMPRRRKVMLGVSLLLVVALVCVAAILVMLHRLEARNAAFQPPMTALERQRLLPSDPVLDTAPRLEGLHYRQQEELKAEGFSPVEGVDAERQGPTNHVLVLHGADLHADAHSGLRPIIQPR
ncbi:hypothetical protein [Pseudomonas sp. LP_7_YM]|uniref:hypothetical protein n=1 Tax=Pseudomonas sp. LP_7_YM TaxID=2485137 RepID=UPI00105E7496|nr:hypothetical protein [Pseudomonas sp. LP_7_YM]TDV67859.1 hypothetical protein EC915_103396 [Pseudomonas sp. LP_7_YM]